MEPVVILIHGTWSDPGRFTKQMRQKVYETWPGCEIKTLDWGPARLSHRARRRGAVMLAKIIHGESKKREVVCIGHSHGANVIFLACRLIDDKFWPKEIITMGMPVMGFYTDDYAFVSPKGHGFDSVFWTAMVGGKDIVQFLASPLVYLGRKMKGKRYRSTKDADRILKFPHLRHRQLVDKMVTWNKIKHVFGGK